MNTGVDAGYGKLQGLKHLAVLDELNIVAFLADLHSKRRHPVPSDVDAEPTLVRGHRKFATVQVDLAYGKLCEALPVFPCGADVLAPIG